jgi:hypothetical protein
MKDVKVRTPYGRGLATTNHAASSHGWPVVVVNGIAYGPDEIGTVDLPALNDPDLVVMYQTLSRAGYTVRA